MSVSPRRRMHRSPSPPASWCSSRSSLASGSRGLMAADMVARRRSRVVGRIRTSSEAEMAEVDQDEHATTDQNGVRVRRAIAEDLSAVLALRLALLREYDDHPIYGRLRRDAENRARPLFEQQIHAVDQAIFLASRGDETVGIVRCADVRGSPLLLPDRYCYVTSVYVRPGHRRHGVLSALMTVAEGWALDRGLNEMRLHNSTMNPLAQSTWDQLGFAVNEEVRLKHIRR